MDFELNDTERMLVDTLERFSAEAPAEAAAQWAQCVEMGWHAASLSEAAGGFGLGGGGAALIARALGAGLSPLDWGRDAFLPALLLSRLAAVQPRAGTALAAFLAGETRVTMLTAAADGTVALPLSPAPDLALILVDAGQELIWWDAPAAVEHTVTRVDGTRFAHCALPQSPRLALDAALTRELRAAAQVVAAADRLGAMAQLFAMTLEYCRTRHQFGRPLSAFQALQHRLVDMSIACDETEALVLAAAMALSNGRADAARLAAGAWLRARDLGQHVGEEAIQLHGGIGMTDECRVGHYVKRLMARAPVL